MNAAWELFQTLDNRTEDRLVTLVLGPSCAELHS